MKVVKITRDRRELYRDRIVRLESEARYPLGADFFGIDHGEDYFAFFDRLGDVHYYAAVDGDRVAAVATGIVRRVPQKTWYLCDLKVTPDYRKRHIPLRMLKSAFF